MAQWVEASKIKGLCPAQETARANLPPPIPVSPLPETQPLAETSLGAESKPFDFLQSSEPSAASRRSNTVAHPGGSKKKGPGFRKEVCRSWIGGLMIIAGLVGAVFFFFFFDTSVEVPTQELFGQTIGGGRVNNLGLMAERQNGIIFSFGIAIVGAVIEFIARSRE
jgi:hypothetical protein